MIIQLIHIVDKNNQDLNRSYTYRFKNLPCGAYVPERIVFFIDPETNSHILEKIYFPGEDVLCFYDTTHNDNGFHRELSFSVGLTNYHQTDHPNTTDRFSQEALRIRSSFSENIGMVKCLTTIGSFINYPAGLVNLAPNNHFCVPTRPDDNNEDDQGPDGNNNDGKGNNNDGKGNNNDDKGDGKGKGRRSGKGKGTGKSGKGQTLNSNVPSSSMRRPQILSTQLIWTTRHQSF